MAGAPRSRVRPIEVLFLSVMRKAYRFSAMVNTTPGASRSAR